MDEKERKRKSTKQIRKEKNRISAQASRAKRLAYLENLHKECAQAKLEAETAKKELELLKPLQHQVFTLTKELADAQLQIEKLSKELMNQVLCL